MKRLALILSLFIVALQGSLNAQTSGLVYDSINNGGIWRRYLVYVPASYTSGVAAPLVFNFHGLGSNASQQLLYSNFQPIADTAGFLMVYPEGTAISGLQFWNVGIFSTPDDVAFVRALLDTIKSDYTVDTERIYTTGMSNGGIMSYYLACQTQGVFAAMASVAGAQLKAWYTNCNPAKAMPVMEIHGDDDATVPYEGYTDFIYGTFIHTDTVMEKWRAHNRCLMTPEYSAIPDTSLTDGCSAEHYKWSQGIDNSSIELFKIIGGGHTWPGALPVFTQTNQDFSASQEIWRFFRQYRLNQFNTLLGVSEQQGMQAATIYPNPANSYLVIEAAAEARIIATSVSGDFTKILKVGDNTISDWPAGVYVIQLTEKGGSKVFKLIKL